MEQSGNQPLEPFFLNPQNRDYVEGKARYPAEYWASVKSSIVSFVVLIIVVPILAFLIYVSVNVIAKSLPIAWIIAVPCLLFALLPISKIVREMRFWRSLRPGQILKGVLSYAEDEGSLTRSDKGYWVKATYEFRSPTGRDLTGNNVAKRDDMRHGRVFYSYDPLPVRGTPVTILYQDDEHYRML